MKNKNTRPSPLLWLMVFLVSGTLGLASVFLMPLLAFGVAGLLGCAAFYFYVLVSRRGKKEFLEGISARLPESSPARKVLTASLGHSDPLETTIRELADMAPTTEAPVTTTVLQAPSVPLEDISGQLENLSQEQEKMFQAIHTFKEVIRDWAGNIEKAGRINKSLLQLNELIVNDSKKVALDTDEAARSATDGIKSVGKEIKAMTEIKATIGSSAEVIQQLSLASDQIGEFLSTITSIARKTNLLALNAGIEAARAGEHGQGFAVVASEINPLAEASAKASADVKHLVDEIRSKTASAIALINTTGKIEENVNVVYSAGDVFMNIVKSIRKAGGLLGEISQALDDQRNDNELLLQLINKIYVSGDHVRERFDLVEQSLDHVQKLSRKMKASFDRSNGDKG